MPVLGLFMGPDAHLSNMGFQVFANTVELLIDLHEVKP
jgi:hypothetical protein